MALTQTQPDRRSSAPQAFAQALAAESAPTRSTRVGRHAPARRLRRWTAFLPVIVVSLVAAGGAFAVGMREAEHDRWLSLATSSVAALALAGLAGLLFLQMLDRRAVQKPAVSAHPDARQD